MNDLKTGAMGQTQAVTANSPPIALAGSPQSSRSSPPSSSAPITQANQHHQTAPPQQPTIPFSIDYILSLAVQHHQHQKLLQHQYKQHMNNEQHQLQQQRDLQHQQHQQHQQHHHQQQQQQQSQAQHQQQQLQMSRKKKTRTVFSRDQVTRLENMFNAKKYLSSSERSQLASSLNLSETQVKIWFQNRRNKYKRSYSSFEAASMASNAITWSQLFASANNLKQANFHLMEIRH